MLRIFYLLHNFEVKNTLNYVWRNKNATKWKNNIIKAFIPVTLICGLEAGQLQVINQ
jgi:hypothetical protein